MSAAKTTTTTAIESEATETPTEFEHRGVTFVIPHPMDLPIEVLEAEDEIELMRLILGPEQWAAYKATKPTVRDFPKLVELVNSSPGN